MSSSTASRPRTVLLLVGAALVLGSFVATELRPGDGTHPDPVPMSDRAPPSVTPTTSRPSETVLWAADHEGGDLDEWSEREGGGLFSSGTYLAAASTALARSGDYALQARIWTPGPSGVRATRWLELRAHRTLHFRAWVHLPAGHRVTGSFLNLFQFKSRSTTGRVDPLWALYGIDDGAGGIRLRVGWGWGGTEVPGPFAGDGVGGKWIEPPTPIPLPTGRWVHLEALLHQSKDFDGRVAFWVDGVEVFDLVNVRTAYPNCQYNAWCAANEWSVNLYADEMVPSPAMMYIDDAAIARPPSAPRVP